MGRGRQKQQGAGGDASSWQLWRGAHSPAQRPWKQQGYGWDKKEDRVVPQFPSYQEMPDLEGQQTGKDMGSSTASTYESGPTYGLQQLLNVARKSEMRVGRIIAQKERAQRQWKAWDQQMKQAFLKEKKRFSQNMDRLDKELAEALRQQEDARLMVFSVAPGSSMPVTGGPAPMEEDEHAWEQARGLWEQEAASDTQGVLERALAQARAAGLTPCTPVRTRPVQPMTPNPHMTVSAAPAPEMPQPVDPYLAAMPDGGPGPGRTPPATVPIVLNKIRGPEFAAARQSPQHPGNGMELAPGR